MRPERNAPAVLSDDRRKQSRKPLPEGIEKRHKVACATNRDGRCSCDPSYRAQVFDSVAGKTIKRTFPTQAAAVSWRRQAQVEVEAGRLRAHAPITVREAAATFLAGITDGSIVTRSGSRYKPSAVRDYEQCFRLRVLPDFGAAKLAELRRADFQRLVGRLGRDGLSPSTIRRTINPLRALYRHAVLHDLVTIDPTDGLSLPAVKGRRDRVAAPGEASTLLRALADRDRALWATAMYAGLRYGELRALRWGDVDMAAGVIRVVRAWDEKDGPILPKSEAGVRAVPIPGELRAVLAAHRLKSVHTSAESLAFGTGSVPFCRPAIYKRARRDWTAAKLRHIALHECRHSYASMMIAAGVNAKTLQTYMGHASITQTMDRYGHLFPGAEHEAAALLDALLAQHATG